MIIDLLKQAAFSILSVAIIGLSSFLGTISFAHLFRIDNLWEITVITSILTVLFLLVCCFLIWLVICLSSWKWDEDYTPSSMDFVFLIPAIYLITSTPIIALIVISFFFYSDIDIGIDIGISVIASAIGGLVFGGILLILCCVTCIVLTVFNVKVGILCGLFNNQHFLIDNVNYENQNIVPYFDKPTVITSSSLKALAFSPQVIEQSNQVLLNEPFSVENEEISSRSPSIASLQTSDHSHCSFPTYPPPPI